MGSSLTTEDKQAFVDALSTALTAYSRSGIKKIEYHQDSDGFESLTIVYIDDFERTINVTGHSCLAIMYDVYKALI